MLSPILDLLLLLLLPLLSASAGYWLMQRLADRRSARAHRRLANAGTALEATLAANPVESLPSPSSAAALAVASLGEARENAQAGVQPVSAPAAVPAQPPRAADVLLVDDSAVARAKLRRLFEQAGFEVHLASDGVEALALLHQGRYALMVTDLEMPNMDGVALVNHCAAIPHAAGMPILAVSGHESLRARFDQCQGIAGVHRKPWVDDILISHAAMLVSARRGRASVPVASPPPVAQRTTDSGSADAGASANGRGPQPATRAVRSVQSV